MKKADYRKIAEYYDKSRPLLKKNLEICLTFIAKYCGFKENLRLLDLGCGTGRFAIPIAQRLHYRVTGADASPEMLAKAKVKDKLKIVTWDCQDAQNLTFEDTSFDAVFISHLLHHVDSPIQVLKECKRVLSTSGVILLRYGASEDIRDDVEHTFFPETRALDEARIPIIYMVETWLNSAGFSNITTETIEQKTYATAAAHLEAIKAKSTSALALISEEAFIAGIECLTKYVKENPDDPWLLFDKMTLTAGYLQ